MESEGPGEPTGGSWLDELSLATRLVFYVIIATIALFGVLLVVEVVL